MFTDVAGNMFGRVSGAVTRIIQQFNSGVYLVWCGALNLNLAVQSVFEGCARDSFQDPLHAIILYLHRQTNLVAEMET